MFLPRSPELRGTLRRIPDGIAGTRRTLDLMREIVNRSRIDPEIRATAINLTLAQPERDEYGEVGQLFAFVRDRIRYVGDVNDVETLTDPIHTLHLEAGDCDDKVTLLASLLESIGYRTRFVVAAYNSADAFEHVILEVFCGGDWLALDPTESGGPGFEPAAPIIRATERER
jgi:transglutaminase-like putative cysteine protease